MRRFAVAGLALLGLSACGEGAWFGEKEIPLPGERISVLLHENTLKPAADLSGHEILLPPPDPNDSWPQDGGFANHAMHHMVIASSPKRAWSVDIGDGADDEQKLLTAPVVSGGRIFAIDVDTEVTAFDEKNGDRLWHVELTPDEEDDGHFGGGLAVAGDSLFVTTGFGQVISLDVKSGKELWRKQFPGPMRAAPTTRGGRLFVVTLDNIVYALNASNGETLWDYTGFSETASMLGAGSPAVANGVVVVAFSSGELVALKVDNGKKLWSDSLTSARRTDAVATLSDIRGRPVIDRGLVIAASNSSVTAAIDLRTGRRVWDAEIASLESPWVAGDYIFLLTASGELVCLSRTEGKIHWITPLPTWEDPEDKTGHILWTGPLLGSDRLVVAGSHGQALAVSPYSGKILGAAEMPDSVSIAPVAAGGTLYFLSDDAELVAYR